MTPFGPHFDAAALRDLAPELAEAFSHAGFTTDGLAGHLGPELTEALYRGEPAPVARGTASDSQLDVLIRFFLLHEHLPATLLADALGARLAAKLLDASVALSDDRGNIYIALDIRPHIIVDPIASFFPMSMPRWWNTSPARITSWASERRASRYCNRRR